MKVIVTGGAGFIGSHVCQRLLALGHKVVSLDNFNDFYPPSVKEANIREIEKTGEGRFESVKADIRDKDAVEWLFKKTKPDLIVHLAAMAGVRPSIENPLLYEDVNVRGTLVLLEACRQHGVKHFVFASSSSVYGNNKVVPFSEAHSVDNPISPYAATKKAGELLCHTYTKLYGLNISCLRFFTVYGPRQRPDLAIHKFTKLMLEGKEIPFFGEGDTRRDYTFIDDILDGVLKSIEWTVAPSKEPKYDIFNLGESHTISLKEMVDTISKAVGKPANIKHLPLQAGDVERTFADVSKAKKELGYAPSVGFEEGIRRFVEWYKKNER